MKNLFFDAGNTLILFDYDLVARTVTEAGFPVTSDQVMRAEYAVRFAVDHLLAPYLLDPHVPVPPMSEIAPYGNFHGHIFNELGVPERFFPEIDLKLKSLYGQLWKVVAPGTADALDNLRIKGYKLNVISNSDGSVERILKDVGLRDYFDQVFDSFIVGFEKPNPQFFEHAMKEVGADPKESMYFGDFYSIDYLGSRKAGMTGVLFDRGALYTHISCARVTKLSEIEGLL
jgi:putative hydrolase of the HAD superfamily